MTTPTHAQALTFTDYIARVKQAVREISVHELAARRAADPHLLVIDVREPDEQDNGVVRGARLVPRGFLEQRIEQIEPRRDAPIALYCAGGTRSAMSALSLAALGYSDVVSLAGGIGAWSRAGFELDHPPRLTREQLARYARQTILPQIGEHGQARLLGARVLVVGAGGLGSPTALYLAAAGVGTLGIVDNDKADKSNLQRQILHDETTVGVSKVKSAEARLRALNSDVKVVTYDVRLDSSNVMDIFRGYDVVVDGTDNFPTRYLINDACVFLKIPNVHGSIYHFDGQVSVFNHDGGPCYRCLYPEPPPPELAPSCAEAGVIGAICGVVGSLQAVETIKVLLGFGDSLKSRILSIDLLHQKVRELKIRKDPHCLVCSAEPKITELIDYEQFCAVTL
ncbi:MAG: molybdopterin-synthase adenylyltransferase MoeB [Deltaproteobacteria bacterium]|nr:molybdopterin-synthase adenylyltransferase MoeB [Deltaproteobacteria bacterium]